MGRSEELTIANERLFTENGEDPTITYSTTVCRTLIPFHRTILQLPPSFLLLLSVCVTVVAHLEYVRAVQYSRGYKGR